MAEVGKKVLKDHKVVSVQEFRQKYAENITSQAVKYAIQQDLIDYIKVDPRVTIIVLTEKTLAYKPNPNIKRKETISL